MTTLTSLDASSNLLDGSALSLASLLTALPTLKVLYLAHNNFIGALDGGLNVGGALRDLNLANNTLEGELPENLIAGAPNLT